MGFYGQKKEREKVMPNRVIKESIWHSGKLSKCSILAQLHYPRLYLLIDDWGCLEVDLAVIKGRVYPKIRITCDKIAGFLKEYNDNGLLFIWEKSGNTYGYFTGNEEGRLPAPSRRHKRHTFEPPKKALGDYLSKFNNLHNLPTKGFKVGSKCLQNGFPNPNPNPNPNPSPNPNKNVISQIIKYLNEKTGKRFSPKSQTSIDFINGRLAEGKTLENFKRVIDVKVAKWGGDPKMVDYLRPSTLFRPTNFENYLNETLVIPSGQSTKKTTPEQDEYYKARRKKEAEIQAKYKKEISDIRKSGDKKAWDILQEKIAEELREWSMNYRESTGGQE